MTEVTWFPLEYIQGIGIHFWQKIGRHNQILYRLQMWQINDVWTVTLDRECPSEIMPVDWCQLIKAERLVYGIAMERFKDVQDNLLTYALEATL